MSATTHITPGSVLLQDSVNGGWMRFANPLQVIQTLRVEEVADKLREVETAVEDRGLYAAGLVAYEAAPGFDPAHKVRTDDGRFPLLWFGLYQDTEQVGDPLEGVDATKNIAQWDSTVTFSAYEQAFRRVKSGIREGDVYQVNLTYRLRRSMGGDDPLAVLAGLFAAQRPSFGAIIATRDWMIGSASPELFFSLDNDRLESRPMKGTAPRGLTLAQDRVAATELRTSEKELAENLMIVDMVRNDMGRVALPGSVEVTELFAVEKYPAMWQLTSTVTAATKASVAEVFGGLFPAASITGAPKSSAMKVIAAVENTPRGIYTGAVGFIAPGRRARFSVAIRTLLFDTQKLSAEYGVGGGIVWDSVCAREQAECRVKSCVTGIYPAGFALLETMLWTPAEGYALLERHLLRLCASAEYFDYAVSIGGIREKLNEFSAGLESLPHKVRLLVDRRGEVKMQAEVIAAGNGTNPCRVRLAAAPVKRSDCFLYHKTTHRKVYDDALAARPGADDVILYNAEGEVTESTRANLAVEVDGELRTPAACCGLLPGTFRAHLLEIGVLRESLVTVAQLKHSRRILLLNSVRGILPAKLM
ncbi:MAG: chorismate-binding protein [Kiritimatiellae bacterium]|nr:chorismate-binding protein [Kiritimatiellia bacterium]